MKERRFWAAFLVLTGNVCFIPFAQCQSYDGARGDTDVASLGFDGVVTRHDGYVKGETPTIPQTSFTCSAQPYNPGLYADMETQCQVYHVCFEDRQESFLCGPGTNFNQRILACDFWYNFDCNESPSYYAMNADIGKVPEGSAFQPSYPSYPSEQRPYQPRPQPPAPRPQPPAPRPQPPAPRPGQPQPPRVSVPPPRPIQPQPPRVSAPPPRVQPPPPRGQPQPPRPQPPRVQPQPPSVKAEPPPRFQPQPPRVSVPPPPPRVQPQPPRVSVPPPPPRVQPQPPRVRPQPPAFRPQPEPQYPRVPEPSIPRRQPAPRPTIQQEVDTGYEFNGYEPPKPAPLPPPRPAPPQTPRPVFPPVVSPPRVSRPPLTPPVIRYPEGTVSRPRVPPVQQHPDYNIKGETRPVQPRPPVRVSQPPPRISRPPVRVSQPPPRISQPPPRVSHPPPRVSQPPPRVSQPPPRISQPPPRVSYPPPRVSQPSRPVGTGYPSYPVSRPTPSQRPYRPIQQEHVDYVPPPPPRRPISPPVQQEIKTEYPQRPIQPPVAPSIVREEQKPAVVPPSRPQVTTVVRPPAPVPRPQRPVSRPQRPIFPPASEHPNANIKGGPGYRPPPPRFEPARISRPSQQPVTATAVKPATVKRPTASGSSSYQPPKKPAESVQSVQHPQSEIKGYVPPRQQPQVVQQRPRAPIVVSRPQPPSLPSTSIKTVKTTTEVKPAGRVKSPSQTQTSTLPASQRVKGYQPSEQTQIKTQKQPQPSSQSISTGIKTKPEYDGGSSYTRGPDTYPKPEFGQSRPPVSTPSRSSSYAENKPAYQGAPASSGYGTQVRPEYPYAEVPGHQPPHQPQVFPYRENPDHPNESIKGSGAYRPPPPVGFQAAASEVQLQQAEPEPPASSPLHGDTGEE